jgi:DNA mismatch endonuclease, patch repair protein
MQMLPKDHGRSTESLRLARSADFRSRIMIAGDPHLPPGLEMDVEAHRTMSKALPNPPAPSTPAVRAAMRGNQRRDTRPELALRSALHARGLRYRVDFPIRPATGIRPIRPDIVFTRAKIAVFVDGCFWHGCPDHGTKPTRNTDYWTAKLERNIERDRRNDALLEEAGWTVVRIWEHEASHDAVIERVAHQVARIK